MHRLDPDLRGARKHRLATHSVNGGMLEERTSMSDAHYQSRVRDEQERAQLMR